MPFVEPQWDDDAHRHARQTVKAGESALAEIIGALSHDDVMEWRGPEGTRPLHLDFFSREWVFLTIDGPREHCLGYEEAADVVITILRRRLHEYKQARKAWEQAQAEREKLLRKPPRAGDLGASLHAPRRGERR